MIYDIKIYVDLRWFFDQVLHSSFDDLVLDRPNGKDTPSNPIQFPQPTC